MWENLGRNQKVNTKYNKLNTWYVSAIEKIKIEESEKHTLGQSVGCSIKQVFSVGFTEKVKYEKRLEKSDELSKQEEYFRQGKKRQVPRAVVRTARRPVWLR